MSFLKTTIGIQKLIIGLLVLWMIPQNMSVAGDLVDQAISKRGPSLGGNSEGSREVEVILPNGEIRKYATTYRDFKTPESAQRMLDNLQKLSREGVFVDIPDFKLTQKPDGSCRVDFLMEHMDYSRSGKRVISSGDSRNLSALSGLPLEQRIAIADELLKKQALHPDGHGLNVMFRQVPIKGGSRVDIRLIDPFSSGNSLSQMADNFNVPLGPHTSQYNLNWQNKYVKEKLGIPVTPHPLSILQIASGYGQVAEESAAAERCNCKPSNVSNAARGAASNTPSRSAALLRGGGVAGAAVRNHAAGIGGSIVRGMLPESAGREQDENLQGVEDWQEAVRERARERGSKDYGSYYNYWTSDWDEFMWDYMALTGPAMNSF